MGPTENDRGHIITIIVIKIKNLLSILKFIIIIIYYLKQLP